MCKVVGDMRKKERIEIAKNMLYSTIQGKESDKMCYKQVTMRLSWFDDYIDNILY